jgi:hypothetical protein
VSWARLFVGFAVVVLLVTSLGPAPTESGPTHTPLAPRSVDLAAHPAGNTSINDEIDLTAASPVGSFAPGTVVRVSLLLNVTSLTNTSATSATVYVPELQAVFPASPASVEIFPAGVNVTLGIGAPVVAVTGSVTIRNETTFNTSGKLTFTSELAALMASEPFGDLTLVDQWNWTVTTPTGAATSSGWGPTPAQVIHPAEVAFLKSLEPRSFTVPSTITACLTGPIQARTFSLHAETPKPVDDFVINTTRNPINGPSTFCLTIVIPATIAPQPLLVHIWDYETVTLLLYIVKVTATNATTNGSGPGGGTDWTQDADIAAIVGVGVVAVGVIVLVRRHPPEPRAPAPPASPPA